MAWWLDPMCLDKTWQGHVAKEFLYGRQKSERGRQERPRGKVTPIISDLLPPGSLCFIKFPKLSKWHFLKHGPMRHSYANYSNTKTSSLFWWQKREANKSLTVTSIPYGLVSMLWNFHFPTRQTPMTWKNLTKLIFIVHHKPIELPLWIQIYSELCWKQ